MLKVTFPRNTLSGIWNVSTLPVLEQARSVARHSAHHLDPKTLRFPTVSICSTLLVCLLGKLD